MHSFNATTLAQLYNSGTAAQNTKIGTVHGFPTPTIFNGFVYMGTDTEVDVFGPCSVNGSSGCLN